MVPFDVFDVASAGGARAVILGDVATLPSTFSYRSGVGVVTPQGAITLSVQFNHTIIAAVDNHESAAFLADILGLEVGEPSGPFVPVTTDNGVTLDFASVPPGVEIAPQHYAFLVSDEVFDAAYARIHELGLTHWADPRREGVNQINHNDGGRGVYFCDPGGNYLELITVPYGGWPS